MFELTALNKIKSTIQSAHTQQFPTNSSFNSIFSRITNAGLSVTEITRLTIPAYWACLKVLSEDIAKLPIRIIKKTNEGRETANPELTMMLSQSPNPLMTSFSFWQGMMHNAANWGESYAEIQRDTAGKAIAMWLIHPTRVVRKDIDGRLAYQIHHDDNSTVILREDQIFRIMGITVDGWSGLPFMEIVAESLNIAKSSQNFAQQFFANGAAITGVLQHPNSLSPEAAERMRENWTNVYAGTDNAGKVAIIEEGMTFQNVQMSMEDAQFLEARQFQVEEIARWFRMPPHKIQDLGKATFSNIEEQQKGYLEDTLMPWIRKIEQEIKRKLITELLEFAKFNEKALLRGSSKDQADFLVKMVNNGLMTINEARAALDLNSVSNGNDLLIQGNNTVTLDSLFEEPEPEPEVIPMIAPPVEEEEEEEEETAALDNEEKISAIVLQFKPMIHHAFAGIVKKEVRKFKSLNLKHSAEKFTEDVNSFYDIQKGYMCDDLSRISNAIVGVTGKDFGITTFINEAISTTRHLLISHYSLAEYDELLVGWGKSKANDLTESFIAHIGKELKSETPFVVMPEIGSFHEADGKVYRFNSNLKYELVNLK